ncbi:4'-phosphopantetheinyl transferase family protein [Streptomyces sp. NBC_01244]|uniref:4'-phosphopantetheinyl transferase family protein n=1 Tax=Streptomyces sp. NBC_01244 TaxID=2903797 RepID=UPI002E119B9C|nr:4'-phosphopantetheinyl transferase superfamily protein [Streptomyces sp. NBC_01244]
MKGASYRALREDDAVHVWQGVASDHPEPGAAELLSAEERALAVRRSGRAGIRYANIHAAVRRVLARYLESDPGEIRLGRQPCPRCPDPAHGRPAVVWPPTGLDFNLSRSGGHWLLALTADRQVGVDIEDPRLLDDFTGTSLFVMSREELAHLASLADEEARTAAFFRGWTRKEAVVKASGVGIVADLSAIEVRPQDAGAVLVRHRELRGPDSWIVQDLPLGPGRYAALAREAGSTGPVFLAGDHGFTAVPVHLPVPPALTEPAGLPAAA